jgi:hypothetical protein
MGMTGKMYKIVTENLKGKDHLGDLDVDVSS